MTRLQFDAMRAADGSLVLGNPEDVAEKIVRWREVLGIERFMLHISVGTMPHDQVMRSIELLGTKVAPLVKQATG
jgi:alkanesulfonate monooxygenase SsuD/methylene tetrahydromethanopterin reductase-like flavin-dependent oxidoreductase (luciferase family)